MKATLAMLACLSMVGLVTAATVDGNNTAVVIQKKAVRANDWQFICVPVNALDITGGTTGTVSASSLLPAELYAAGTSIYIVDAASGGSAAACTLVESTVDGVKTVAWTAAATEKGTTEFTPGTILWIKDPADISSRLAAFLDASTSTTTKPTSIVFCGQERGDYVAVTPSTTAGSLTPMKNDSSTALTLPQVLPATFTPGAGDKIYVLEEGNTDYKRYSYGIPSGSGWTEPKWNDDGVEVTDPVIAAGEAFFYYKR